MRLINTTTLELEEFLDRIPQYAILSHRWGDPSDEFKYDDIEKIRGRFPNDRSRDKIVTTDGYRKVRSFCEIAHARGLQYAWADTCCIDKTSATELSEAINSMARWYAQADVCVVYLSDVLLPGGNEPGDIFQQLELSEWFTRGWTLQELLMPRKLIFYSASWERIGALDKDRALIGQALSAPVNLSPSNRGFLSSLERASHIRIDDLCITDQYQTASIAQRMFWASHRVTTREEDRSYSLFGIFDIAAPLIYGEGSKSFIRLQEEIMKTSNDESVFAWISRPAEVFRPYTDRMPPEGNMLAMSPADFSDSNDIERTPLNMDRAMVVNGNGIDMYRDSNNICVFRRQRGNNLEQLLFIVHLGCERQVPGQLEDPCTIAFLAEIRRNASREYKNVVEEFLRSPIPIQRRIMSDTLSSANMPNLSELGFELVKAQRPRKYHFWLPFENCLRGRSEMERVNKRRLGSRL